MNRTLQEEKIKGVIFDLDGTLIDSYQAIYLSFRFVYEKLRLSPLPYDEVKRIVGLGLGETFRDLLGEERVSEALRLFRQKYAEVYKKNTILLPDVREVLEALYHRGIRMAIATNKFGSFSRDIIRELDLEKRFLSIVGDGDLMQNKPHPEIILYILEKMGLQKDEAIFVGDSPIDIQTGKNAGIRVMVVPTGATGREELMKFQPAVVLSGLLDLLTYFK